MHSAYPGRSPLAERYGRACSRTIDETIPSSKDLHDPHQTTAPPDNLRPRKAAQHVPVRVAPLTRARPIGNDTTDAHASTLTICARLTGWAMRRSRRGWRRSSIGGAPRIGSQRWICRGSSVVRIGGGAGGGRTHGGGCLRVRRGGCARGVVRRIRGGRGGVRAGRCSGRGVVGLLRGGRSVIGDGRGGSWRAGRVSAKGCWIGIRVFKVARSSTGGPVPGDLRCRARIGRGEGGGVRLVNWSLPTIAAVVVSLRRRLVRLRLLRIRRGRALHVRSRRGWCRAPERVLLRRQRIS
ncbi:hypothetical protein P152DRAFT_346637 [Eremomyces bilateralis CBS 781.70]|uniref:Uncharacterized protein n=1 Tax=Eremomyces bilateralis CBS 781.70 TaxID=1392243 RepID=A0A6G1G3K8_9PEZI|nr:uncharacterized protein P152DRAFT_346637 [Eremomyces bilateralis CBS 781.70]KAF1812697.1 hypothetical protein P152DRAFT_346637 [Eremomyces bilateralis CBS 781.70]